MTTIFDKDGRVSPTPPPARAAASPCGYGCSLRLPTEAEAVEPTVDMVGCESAVEERAAVEPAMVVDPANNASAGCGCPCSDDGVSAVAVTAATEGTKLGSGEGQMRL
mmetsp:Transcript_8425/g.26390  ORF Transcript_8425/g.26390 Transcript_8425/m.26390 type:complete len:108 (-) Transcript_8425:200-523(-)